MFQSSLGCLSQNGGVSFSILMLQLTFLMLQLTTTIQHHSNINNNNNIVPSVTDLSTRRSQQQISNLGRWSFQKKVWVFQLTTKSITTTTSQEQFCIVGKLYFHSKVWCHLQHWQQLQQHKQQHKQQIFITVDIWSFHQKVLMLQSFSLGSQILQTTFAGSGLDVMPHSKS